tara:strand:- start:160 stop:372 length:213 start_codon:yes stop_codon:yes gene_type:complete
MIGKIVLFAFAGLSFWCVFAAFRDGEASTGGENGGQLSAKKEKNPVGFYFIVAVEFLLGICCLYAFYKIK